MINYPSSSISDFTLQLILNNFDEPFILLDRNLEIVTFNAAAQSAFELVYKKTLQKQKQFLSILENDDVKKLSLVLANVMRGQPEEVQYRVTLEDASFKIFFTSLKPLYRDGQIIGATLTLKDVTNQFVTEDELRKSNNRFRRASLASYDIIWEHDLLNHTIQFSENFSSSFGYKDTIKTLSLKDFEQQFIHPDDRTLLSLSISNFLASKQLHFTFPIHRLLKSDGSAVYAEANAIVSRDENGKPYRFTGVTRDITDRYLMEQRLRESNERYELAARASFDLIFEANFQTGKIIHNDIITSLYGYEPGELRTLDDITQFVHPEDIALIDSETKKMEATGNELFHIPLLRLLKKNREIVYTEIKALVIRDHHGKLQKRIGTARDITYRYLMEQEMHKSNERYELATNASSDLIWDRDFVTNRFYYNETFVNFYGYTREELSNPDEVFARFPHPDDRKWLLETVTKFLNSGQTRLTYPVHRLLKADGTPVYVEATGLLIRDDNGKPIRMIGVSKDITDRYLMEQQLRNLNNQLKARATELEASNKELERFAYVASHDLQEPLRMVSSFMALFEKKYNDVLDDTGRQYIHFAVDGANRMKRLILDLLQFSRIGTSSEKVEITDLNEIVRQVLLEFTFTIQEKKAVITVLPLPELVVNKSQIEQVFRNLISNALKYNTSDQPAIDVGCVEEAEDYRFFVKDNGIGIEERFFNKIFVIFQQLHTKNEYSGTGIGLAITKKIIEQHRGRIWLESVRGHGSTFYFTIPK